MQNLEKQMQNDAENVLREWDTSVKRRTEGSLRVRAGSFGANEIMQRRLFKKLSATTAPCPSELSAPSTVAPTLRFDFPEMDVIHREDTSYKDSTADMSENDSRRFEYAECPTTGSRLFRIELDVKGFQADDITIKTSGGRLTVHGVRQEIFDGRKSTNEFCRKIKLPDDVAADERIKCRFVNEKLIIEAPALANNADATLNSATSADSLGGSPPDKKHLPNRPVIVSNEDGRHINLIVDVGRVFKAKDVTVRVTGQSMITVTAETIEKTAYSRTSANLQREFDLPEKIDRRSLSAAFTENGFLKITAKIDEGRLNGWYSTSQSVPVKIDISDVNRK